MKSIGLMLLLAIVICFTPWMLVYPLCIARRVGRGRGYYLIKKAEAVNYACKKALLTIKIGKSN